MLIKKVKKNGLTGKMWHNDMGYRFTILYKNKIVMTSYVHLTDKKLCEERMIAALDTLDKERLKENKHET